MITSLYPHTTKAFEKTVVENKGNYPYPISPFSGVVSPIRPELLTEISQAAKKEKSFTKADLIITFESAGTQLATVVGQALNLPYLVARKKRFNLPNEISFAVSTNFDEKQFYIYGDVADKKILIIDDVIASGATVKNAIEALKMAGATVKAIFAVAAKTNLIGIKYQDTLEGMKTPLISLIKIKVVNEKVIVF